MHVRSFISKILNNAHPTGIHDFIYKLLRSLQLLRVWLTLASLAHSHGRDEAGRECDILVITYTKWLRSRAAHNMGNLWQCCNVHKKPPSIAPSLPPSVPACLPASRPTDWPIDPPTDLPILTVPTWRREWV